MGPALPIIAVAATVIGTGVAVYGAEQSAAAQSKAAQYQAEVAAQNAKIAQQNAQYANEAGASQAESQEMKTRAAIGQEKAAQASSGLDVNSGSATDIRSSTAALGTLSELNIRNNAARQAYGYMATAGSESAQSALDVANAQQASTAGDISAVSNLLAGAGSTGAMLTNYQRTGAFFQPNKIVS